jgi:hypothetical protein
MVLNSGVIHSRGSSLLFTDGMPNTEGANHSAAVGLTPGDDTSGSIH